MQTEFPSDRNDQTRALQRMESSMRELNARIARLAMALGVSLQSDDDVMQVMQRGVKVALPHGERRATAERRSPSRLGMGQDRRVSSKWRELRGLMVLRYGMETRFVADVGSPATREILRAAEEQMRREGFRPGVDGVDPRMLGG